MSSPLTTDILLVSADLFLGSRIRGAAESQGRSVDTASTGAAAAVQLDEHRYRLVLIDLETPGLDVGELVERRAESNVPPFVAYGPHVKVAHLKSARNAGCDEVLTRGQFDATLSDLLARYLNT